MYQPHKKLIATHEQVVESFAKFAERLNSLAKYVNEGVLLLEPLPLMSSPTENPKMYAGVLTQELILMCNQAAIINGLLNTARIGQLSYEAEKAMMVFDDEL